MSPRRSLLDSGRVQLDVPLGPLTTYKTGGPARFFAKPVNLTELRELAGFVGGEGVEVLVIGRGSNLLVADAGYEGLVIHMAEGFSELSFDGLEVSAGAGIPLPRLARASVDAGIAGLEFFVGIPGSVGGAVRQNAGCFGVETRDRMTTAHVLDLRTGLEFDASPDELDMAYRHSNLMSHQVVVSARFAGLSADVSGSSDRLKEITRWRKENQPGGTLNAGSVFKNPAGESAGSLIDRAGLKGLSVGKVSVSQKHANFFVAGRGASSSDIFSLINEVRRRVQRASGIELEPEIRLVGFDDGD